MVQIECVLFPTDFSEMSLSALPYAVSLAEKYQTQLHVLHVVEPTDMLSVPPEGMAPQWRDDDLMASADKQMDQFRQKHLSGRQAISKVVLGHPLVEIVRYAKLEKVGLIVMSTHGRSGLAHVLMGSIAEKVVRKAPCPVLTIRDPGHEFVMP